MRQLLNGFLCQLLHHTHIAIGSVLLFAVPMFVFCSAVLTSFISCCTLALTTCYKHLCFVTYFDWLLSYCYFLLLFSRVAKGTQLSYSSNLYEHMYYE